MTPSPVPVDKYAGVLWYKYSVCLGTPFVVRVKGVPCCGFVWSLCGAPRGVVEVPLSVCGVGDFCDGVVNGEEEVWVVVPPGFEGWVRAPVSCG